MARGMEGRGVYDRIAGWTLVNDLQTQETKTTLIYIHKSINTQTKPASKVVLPTSLIDDDSKPRERESGARGNEHDKRCD